MGQLHHAHGRGAGTEVTDEPLDRPGDGAGAVFGADRAELGVVELALPDTGDLHGTDGSRGDPRLEAGRVHLARGGVHRLLAGPDRDTADHAVNLVAGGAGIGEPLEHEDDSPLARRTPVTAAVEGRTGPCCQRAIERQSLEGHEIEVALSGGTQHRVAFPLAKEIDGGGQRRHARAIPGVERECSAHEIERFRQSAGERGTREAARLVDERRHPLEELFAVGLDDPLDAGFRDTPGTQRLAEMSRGLREPEPHLEIVGELPPEHRADDDPGPDAIEGRHPADLGDRCIGGLEEHELERIGGGDLLGGHLVAPPVVGEALDECPRPGGRVPSPWIRGIEGAGEIPPRPGHAPHSRAPLLDQTAEGVHREGAGKHAPDADDRHGGVIGVRRGAFRRRDGRSATGEVFGDRQMDVEAADAEGVDRGAAGLAVCPLRPRDRPIGNHERTMLPIEVLVVFGAGRTRRNEAVLHGEHDLDEARHAGGLEGVADVGLDAPDRDFLSGGNIGRDERRQGAEFGGVADLRARGMGLDVVEATDLALVGVGTLDGEFLPLLPRCPEALSLAVAGDADPADHGTDAVTVGDRPGERLHHEGNVPLGGHQPIGIASERARTGVAHRLRGREQHEAVRLAVRGTADDRLIDSLLPQRPGSDRQSLQRRGAGRVDDEVGAFELEGLANDLRGTESAEFEFLPRPAARMVTAHSRGDLGRDRVGLRAEEFAGSLHLPEPGGRAIDPGGVDVVADPVAPAGVAHIDARTTSPRHRERIETGIPAGQGRDFEEHVMGHVVAIEHVGTDRTDRRVGGAITDDRPQIGVALADLALLGIEVEVARQACVRQSAPGGATVHHEVPEGIQAVGAGKPACHADNRQ